MRINSILWALWNAKRTQWKRLQCAVFTFLSLIFIFIKIFFKQDDDYSDYAFQHGLCARLIPLISVCVLGWVGKCSFCKLSLWIIFSPAKRTYFCKSAPDYFLAAWCSRCTTAPLRAMRMRCEWMLVKWHFRKILKC